MPSLRAADGTELAYHVQGDGRPLICIPGGPMRASSYLGDLGGLSAQRQLIMLDLRGTGQSATPPDYASCRCDRLVDDVCALQDHLGLDGIDLLGHSAGTNIAVQYATRYPQRVRKLALIGPSSFAIGMEASSEMRREIVLLRQGEDWYAEAAGAFERIQADGGSEEDWDAIGPLRYGRWDAAAQADYAANPQQVNETAAVAFSAPGAFDPETTRAAIAVFDAPVLMLAGELDLNSPPPLVARYAALFPDAKLVIQPGAGHSPWLDDAQWFASAVDAFLEDGS